MNVTEKFAQLKAIYAEAQAKAAPLVAELKPFIQAAQRAEQLGLSSESTPEEIIDAFAGSVALNDAPVRPLIPQVLQSGAPAEIARAGEEVVKMYEQIGVAVGRIAGTIVGMM